MIATLLDLIRIRRLSKWEAPPGVESRINFHTIDRSFSVTLKTRTGLRDRVSVRPPMDVAMFAMLDRRADLMLMVERHETGKRLAHERDQRLKAVVRKIDAQYTVERFACIARLNRGGRPV